jgi:hypothetical protein
MFFTNMFHNFYLKLCVICFQISLIFKIDIYRRFNYCLFFFTHLHSDRQKGDSLTDPVDKNTQFIINIQQVE